MAPPDSAASPLARFPANVRAAFDRFNATRDDAALQVVVDAIVGEFTPRPPGGAPKRTVEAGLSLIDDLGFDSIAIAELVFFFEDLFGVSINNKDLLALRTVADLQGYVSRRATGKPS